MNNQGYGPLCVSVGESPMPRAHSGLCPTKIIITNEQWNNETNTNWWWNIQKSHNDNHIFSLLFNRMDCSAKKAVAF